jgi:periplasmic copper chaperone A
MSRALTHLTRAVIAGAVAVTLAACGSTAPSGSSPSASPSGSSSGSAAGLSAADAWVKTAPSGMTAAFLTLTNSSDADQVVVSASSPAAAMVQIHETVDQGGQMVMQENKDGITVKAHGTAVLEPGGDHLMLMSVAAPIKAGDLVPFTLTLATGATLTFSATAKDFSGAQESYQPSPSGSGSGS